MRGAAARDADGDGAATATRTGARRLRRRADRAGALGVVSAVTLQAVPGVRAARRGGAGHPHRRDRGLRRAHDLDRPRRVLLVPAHRRAPAKRNTRVPLEEGLAPLPRWRAVWDDEILANGAFAGVVAAGRRVPALVPPLARLSARALGARTWTDHSHRVFVSRRRVRFREMEYAVPRADAARRARRAAPRARGRTTGGSPFPVEVRVAAADDIPLSTASGRDTAYIAAHVPAGTDPGPWFAALEAIAGAVGGRPHWGKLHGLDAAVAARPGIRGSTSSSRCGTGSTRPASSPTPTSTGCSARPPVALRWRPSLPRRSTVAAVPTVPVGRAWTARFALIWLGSVGGAARAGPAAAAAPAGRRRPGAQGARLRAGQRPGRPRRAGRAAAVRRAVRPHPQPVGAPPRLGRRRASRATSPGCCSPAPPGPGSRWRRRWLVAQLGMYAAMAGLTATIADDVPPEQRGAVSAAVYGPQALGIVVGLGLVTAVGGSAGRRVPAAGRRCSSSPRCPGCCGPARRRRGAAAGRGRSASALRATWLAPGRHPDYAWAFAGRLLVNLGNALGTTYLLYFLTDGLRVADPEGSLLVLTLVYLVATVAATWGGGVLSDRTGRRRVFVAGAAVLQALACARPGRGPELAERAGRRAAARRRVRRLHVGRPGAGHPGAARPAGGGRRAGRHERRRRRPAGAGPAAGRAW